MYVYMGDRPTAGIRLAKDSPNVKPILDYQPPAQTFILDKDASNTSIGAVLSQILHRIGKDHCIADALSRYPETSHVCDCYKAGMDPLTLACNGCQHGSKLHTQWEKFEADVDDVLPKATRRITAIDPNDNTDSHCTWIEGYSRMQLQEEQLKDSDSVVKNLIEWMKHGPPERNTIVK
ncbi:unnamed protein product [Mytilus edulis]|uniref:Reverse transcriptase/retrotransposon-derived protein RNase H-like domain-containing protein n=1 Tax=Mytilus edulis TaxID=6550 RepID=A0A8S3QH26_MYTED|nr:unnamed protein product [Mytilus edulis]